MYLKSLELHGFKSFPEKTVLKFDHGATVIVGPNGSGKSNITDAMRWVLGELSSKSIRGSKMEDVIFVGADGYRQMNFAEVSVTFDDSQKPKRLNSEYDEVTVTRRYYRTGESEYYINRKPVRLKDINELFMNTGIGRDGYSIIGQGKIAEIISKKSDERRGIFEETAGISKYRYRKHESERKLAETEENMVRVADILRELEARVGPLERASQKARKYIDLFEKKKEADISLWLYDMVQMKKEADKLSAEVMISAHELEMTEDSISQLEAQSERLFNASQENKQSQSRIYEEIKSLREHIHELENKYRIIENNISHSEENIENLILSADKNRSDAAEERTLLASLEEKLNGLKTSADKTEAEIEASKAEQEALATEKETVENMLSEAFDRLKSEEAQKSEIDIRLSVIENLISQHSKRSEAINADIAKYESELAELDGKIEEINENINDYRTNVEAADKELLGMDKKLNEKSDAIEAERITLSSSVSAQNALESRIAALTKMQEHFDGYNNSVKHVMSESSKGTLTGIHGPVSYLINVPEKYTVAIETALGASLQSIIVDDEESAKSAIRSLKNSNAGRATFYPITSVRSRIRSRELDECASQRGFIGYADELVRADEKYSEIVSSLLGSIAVFDNIDNATVSAKKSSWKVRIVTLDGQQINAGGSFTGGSVRRDSGMLTRQNQIDRLKSELNAKLAEKETIEKKIKEMTVEYDTFRSLRSQTEERVKIVEAMMRTESVECEELTARREVTAGLLEQLRGDLDSLSSETQSGAENSEKLRAEAEAAGAAVEKTAKERIQLDARRHDIDSQIETNTEKLSALRIGFAEQKKDIESAENEIASSKERIKNSEAAADECVVNAEKIRQSISELKNQMSEMLTESENEKSTLDKKEEERFGLEQGSLEFEKKMNELRLKIRDMTSKKELQLSAHTKTENKLQLTNSDIDKMTSRIYDEYELTHAQALELGYPEVTADSRPEVVSVLNEMKTAIKALGHVNVDAIDEYAEIKERYDFLKAQMEDLTSSKNDLDSIISSIESEMERIFKDAFAKINQNFGEVFKELFGGGHAELSLTDPEDVLNCGIEISAAPPGKMIKNLSLLSGGEQAFVAIALMFALIKVNPSPFCIFDEIEAALDEVNVNRVANYISRFSKDIQIIMITHRRGTMEIADTLYGVTMPRHGISKVFTLDVGAVAKQQFIEEHMS